MISLILAVCIIAILFVLYFRKSGNGGKSTLETGQKALQDTRANNAAQLQENIDTQNELNSINQ